MTYWYKLDGGEWEEVTRSDYILWRLTQDRDDAVCRDYDLPPGSTLDFSLARRVNRQELSEC